MLGKGGLPASGVAAVSLNVTVTDGENPAVGGGFVTVYPCGTRPDASNLNFTSGQTVANAVIAPVSATGQICFYVYGTAHLLADVSGYFPTGSDFKSLSPTRCSTHERAGKVGSASGDAAALELSVLGKGGLPSSGIGAVALNVTAAEGREPDRRWRLRDRVSVWHRPDASNLNFVAGQTVPNLVVAPVSATGTVCFYVYGTAHLLADVSGYFPTASVTRVVDPVTAAQHSLHDQGRQRHGHRNRPGTLGAQPRRPARNRRHPRERPRFASDLRRRPRDRSVGVERHRDRQRGPGRSAAGMSPCSRAERDRTPRT